MFLAIENLTKRYPTREGVPVIALDAFSLNVEHREFVSILGPSGCGKSTLMMMVAGLERASSGSIKINNSPVVGPQTELGIVFQEPTLLEWKTVLGNLMIQAEIRGLDRKTYQEKAVDLLERVGLRGFSNRLPHELSGGMQQRTSICRALLHDPPLLLMDEPFGALDAMTRDDLNLELQAIWMNSPKTVLFITHSISEAVLLSDRIIVMSPRPGKIVREINVTLPRPRSLQARETPEFARYTAEIRELFTSLGVMKSDPFK